MEKQQNKMKVAIIPAYNDESTVGSVVLKTKLYVDKVIVIDDHSKDDTSKMAKLAGAEVIINKENLGKSKTVAIGFKRALELNADIIITLDADSSNNPNDIPNLVSSIESGNYDISIGYRVGRRETGFRAFTADTGFRAFTNNAVKKIYPTLLKSSLENIGLEYQKISDSFKTETVPIEVKWLPSFKRYDEHILNSIEKLNTTNEIYNEKRKVQKTLSKLESYKLLSETFLKFIPPAIVSLIISLTIIIPATNIIHLQIGYVLAIGIIIILTFLVCWYLLIVLLDKIYQNSIYLEALDRRLEQKENPKKNNSEKE
jgi:glycosyltransferase involved in cell wall biosynthesis